MLTSDVANLANEKEELNNKLKEVLDGKSFFNEPFFSSAVSRMRPDSFSTRFQTRRS